MNIGALFAWFLFVVAVISRLLNKPKHKQQSPADHQNNAHAGYRKSALGKTRKNNETSATINRIPPSQHQDDGRDRRDKWRLAIEAFAVFVLLLASVAALVSLCYLKRSTDATAEAADAAKTSARIAVAAQRAWIHNEQINVFPDSIDALQGMQVIVPLINSGKLPATRIAALGAMDIVPVEDSPSFSFQQPASAFVGVLFPGGVHQSVAGKGDPAMNGRLLGLSASGREVLLSGKAYLVVYGQITYQDDFGPHWTRYCTWRNYGFRGVPNIAACVLYNAVGDGPPPN